MGSLCLLDTCAVLKASALPFFFLLNTSQCCLYNKQKANTNLSTPKVKCTNAPYLVISGSP